VVPTGAANLLTFLGVTSMSRRRTTALFRPFVEVLEGRWVPTTLTPTTFLDGGLGSGSLRDAVLQFNADTGTDDDIIQLEAGTYSLTIPNVSGRHESAGLTGDLNLTQTSHRWIIQGAGPSTIIDASQLQDRVFQIVNPGTHVLFQDLVIQGGLAQDNGADAVQAGTTDALGGGIFNNGGDLTLDDVVLQNNGAQGGDAAFRLATGYNAFGGGIYSTGGALTLAGATIANNQATGGRGGDSSRTRYLAGAGGSASGAGLYASGGSLDISDSRIANNQATGGRGGDGYFYTTIQASITHTFYTGGTGGGAQGGGLYVNGGSLTVASSTITSNRGTAGSAGRYGFEGDSLGGGLYVSSNAGTAMVTGSTLSGNSANGSSSYILLGGGIYSHGTLTVNNSTLSGNSASSTNLYFGYAVRGGGIYSDGTLTVNNSTLSGNSASSTYVFPYGAYGGGGGGIDNDFGTLTLSNSTLSGNTSVGRGGGMYTVSAYPVTLTNVTLTANRADTGGSGYQGGGLYDYGSVVLDNTLIAGNFRGATGTTRDDVLGPLDSGGDYNLIGDGTGMSGLTSGVNGNQVGSASAPIDPLLSPLQANGGPTLTHALLPGSPAIDAGNNAYATDWDQRGPGYPRIVNGIIDIGAFEFQAPAASYPTRLPLPETVPVQALGMPDGPLVGQPPDLLAAPSPLPGPGIPNGHTGQPEPVPVPAAGEQQAPETRFGADAGNRQLANALGPPDACDRDPLAQELLGGP
jgi:hypothetical protein